jgi:hypothetical protein
VVRPLRLHLGRRQRHGLAQLLQIILVVIRLDLRPRRHQMEVLLRSLQGNQDLLVIVQSHRLLPGTAARHGRGLRRRAVVLCVRRPPLGLGRWQQRGG